MTKVMTSTPEPDDLEPIVILDDAVTIAGASDQPDIDPRLLSDVVTYAQARVAAGEGASALRVVGADQPTLVAAYGIGYLPRTWQSALGAVARGVFAGRRLADTLVLPAYDVHGAVVDLLAIHARTQGGAYVGVFDQPRGLVASRVASVHTALTVSDSLRVVARGFATGRSDMLLLRGLADTEVNAARLYGSGVRHVVVRTRTNAEAIASVLRAAGIATAVVSAHPQSDGVGYEIVRSSPCVTSTTEATPIIEDVRTLTPAVMESVRPACAAPTSSDLTLVNHDHHAERATFTCGAVTYVVEVPSDAITSRLDVVVRHAGQVHRETLDLSVDAARRRFAGNAALRCRVDAVTIATHLSALLTHVRQVIANETAADDDARVSVAHGPEREAALSWLRDRNLLDHIVRDLTTLGWVGEDAAKKVLLLTAISRKLTEPLWAMRTASREIVGSHGLGLIAELTPPEDLIHVSRLTNAALAYQDAHSLRHKLLIIDEATALTPDVMLALRVLHQRGALSQAVVPRHNLSGSVRTQTIEVRGPIAVLSATTGKLDHGFTTTWCLVPVDESADQTARVLAAERVRYAQPSGGCDAMTRSAIRHQQHTLQRLIASHPVVIPFAERIAFPATTLRQRGEHARFLSLVAASALVHQYQRLSDRGHVVADVRDFDLAVSLAEAAGIGAEPDLGRPAAVLLHALHHAGITTFTSESALALLPHWGRTSFRSAVADLLRLEYVTSPDGGRGQRRSYSLIAGQQPEQRPTITLRPVTTDEELVSWSVVGQFATDQLNSRPRAEIDAVG